MAGRIKPATREGPATTGCSLASRSLPVLTVAQEEQRAAEKLEQPPHHA